MSDRKVLITETHLEDIADAIRERNGGQSTYTPGQMPAAIEAIPNAYAAGDEGKVVSSGALVSQTTRTVTSNDTYDTTLNNSVTVNVAGTSTLVAKTITENGVYDPADDNADGYSGVTVNVAGALSWRDTFSVNWDFSNPVNTRGSSSYGSTQLIYTLDGWQLQGGKLSFVTGGIKLERYASGTAGYFMQRYKNTITSSMVGKTFTLSCMADGGLGYRTDTIPSSNHGTTSTSINGVRFRIWNYGSEIAVTIDIDSDTGSHVIQAIKLEAGANQTLATQVNGVWVLNNSMDADTEYIKARNGTVYNS